MPDLTVHTTWHCASLTDEWFVNVKGSKGYHSVRYGYLDPSEQNRQGCQYGFTCTCDGFRFRGTCKHVKAERKKLCHWNAVLELAEPRHTRNGPRCPKCGGPVKAVQVGV